MFTVYLTDSDPINIDADGFKVTPDNHLVFFISHPEGGNSTIFMAAAGKWQHFTCDLED